MVPNDSILNARTGDFQVPLRRWCRDKAITFSEAPMMEISVLNHSLAQLYVKSQSELNRVC